MRPKTKSALRLEAYSDLTAPRGNPNKPAARFLFHQSYQRLLEEDVVAAVLRDVWHADSDNWENTRAQAVAEARQVYLDYQAYMRVLIRLEPQEGFGRDERHLQYHSQHAVYLV
jgi:hypothetical protein